MEELFKIEFLDSRNSVTKVRYYKTEKGFLNQRKKFLKLNLNIVCLKTVVNWKGYNGKTKY